MTSDKMSPDAGEESNEAKSSEKKIRKRKKQLYKAIKDQMEFYFGDSNLMKDKFLKELLTNSEDGYVDLEIFLKFNKIRALTTSPKELAQAVATSELLQVEENETSVRIKRTTPISERDDFDESTIYIEHIPPDADHDWIRNIFGTYGNITYVRLPRYKGSNQNKGFAFIEYDSPKAAQLACEHFGASTADFKNMENTKQKKKRTRSPSPINEEEEPPSKKKKKRDETTQETEISTLAEMSDIDQSTQTSSKSKKKKRKRQKKIKHRGEEQQPIPLRVITKLEWKRLRNKYLTLQKTSMAELKGLLLLQPKVKTQPLAKPEPTEQTNGIIKLTTPIEIDAPSFKIDAASIATVLYVDNHSSPTERYIRCLDDENARKLLESSFLKSYGKAELLEGEEEREYMEKVKDEREQKHSLKGRFKKRGREKLIAKAEELVAKSKPTHIHFDD